MKIGIPQALSYYYYPYWSTFFEKLGHEVIHSGPTDRQKLNSGIRIIPSEACLPLKCFFGHVLSLLDKADCIFIPRLVCLQRERGIRLGCPKLIGLPDMAKAFIPNENILTTDIDLRVESEAASYAKLAQKMGIPLSAGRQAYAYAKEQHEHHRQTTAWRLAGVDEVQDKILIGLLGHAYLLNDEYLNLNIIKKIEDLGVSVVNCHLLPEDEIDSVQEYIKPISWHFEGHIISAAYFFQHATCFSGIIYLLSFGCGAGSITHEVIDNELGTPRSIPFLKIVLDEHTAEAGLMTRIESFLDMIRLKKKEAF